MAVTYYALLTTIGAGKLANATALGTSLKITQLAVGDGGGNVPTPDASRTNLVNEVRRAPLNRLSVDPANSSQIIAEQVIPEDVGGWWIREMGLYDEVGALIAYANCAPSYKPQLAEGSGRTQTVRIVLIVSNAASVELKIDPSVVLATREYVDSAIVSAMNRLDCKQSVRVASTASITLSGLQTLDGVALIAGDRVLVKNQSNSADNGIYVAAAAAWKRSTDADESGEVTPGLTVVVESGTSQADSIWQLVTDGAIILGTTALSFQNITNGLAKLASPAFSGTPTAPNPAQGDLSTRLATTSYVRNLVAGQLTKSVAGGADVTLTADEVGYGMLVFTGVLTANINVIVPNVYRQWVVHNRTSGAFTVTIKTAAGAGVTVTQGRQCSLVCNSVDVYYPEMDFVNTYLAGRPTTTTAARGDSSTAVATTAYVQDTLNSSGLASTGAGEAPADASALAALKSGMYYLPANVSPYSNYAFLMRMTYGGNRGFEIANIPSGDRFFGRSSNSDGTWRAPVELAKLDSPALSGVPTAPTPSPGSNSQQLATTAFVQSAVSPLAPLASPTLTGNPTAPTPAQYDNDTSIATTAFVKSAGVQFSSWLSFSTAGVAIPSSACGRAIQLSLPANGTLTLPSAASVPNGSALYFSNSSGTTTTTLQRVGSDNIAQPQASIMMGVGPGDDLVLISNGVNAWFAVSGSARLGSAAAFAASPTVSGYQRLPSGLLIQWGNAVIAQGASSGNFPFTLPFPSTCFQVIACDAGNSCIPVGASPITNSQFVVYRAGKVYMNSGDLVVPGIVTFRWFAVGI
ncbi:phage tail protein [Pseudomonas sp. AU11447]|uniref:phage tail protein n=1 Tax=unclassified Pseudomonas TaxID=196821 RepID=UPI000B07DFA9